MFWLTLLVRWYEKPSEISAVIGQWTDRRGLGADQGDAKSTACALTTAPSSVPKFPAFHMIIAGNITVQGVSFCCTMGDPCPQLP